ncbi:MAG: hypothetical protein HY257_08940 [Chloroflexi bacterium]|nr:hypothetical protein [Chloroflexota bacterium]
MAKVNIFSNDPSARGLALEQVDIPEGESRFAIPGWNGTGGLFEPGTREFQAGALYVILNRTHRMWMEFFGDPINWQPGVKQLAVNPRAGKDFNAYYDRTALKFFYNDDKTTGQTIYTCESSDISAHECGHAVLDARHPDYWDSLLAETGAFHEAFGDISALLLTLGDPNVRAEILQETGGDLTKSNSATRLAEQLARTLDLAGYDSAVVSKDALRDFVNQFNYQDPDKLPGHGSAAQLTSESHNFARVFTGAFYDLLVGIYNRLLAENPASPDDALAQARAIAGRIIGEGLDLAPKGDAPYKTIAISMLKSNGLLFGGAKYFEALRNAFVARGILSASDADAFKSSDGTGNTQTSTGGETIHKETPARLGTAGVRVGKELPSEVATSLGLSRTDFSLVGEAARRAGSRVLDFRKERQFQMMDDALGDARGVVVDVADSVTVLVDENDKVVTSHAQIADEEHESRIQDHVAKLIARKRVFVSDESEIDPNELIERRQPYYIAPDAQGNKRLHRAFVACDCGK